MSHTVARVCSPPAFDGPKRHVAGTAGDVEQRERPGFWRIERGDQRILPGPMQAERHEIVHQVVARRDAVEHVVDQRLLVRKRHLARAEMGVCHRWFPCHANHSAAAQATLCVVEINHTAVATSTGSSDARTA